jgi:hypothetical protein
MPRLTEPRYEETLCGGAYTAEEVDFFMAMDRYKRQHDRPFPTWHEVLRVLKGLGYRRPQARAQRVRQPRRRLKRTSRIHRRRLSLSPRHRITPPPRRLFTRRRRPTN